MKQKKIKIALIICSLILAAELIFLGATFLLEKKYEAAGGPPTMPTQSAGQTTEDTTPTTDATGDTQPGDTTDPSTQATEPATEPTTEPAETEPKEQRYVLTFVGDCTLASAQGKHNATGSFVKTVGEDYDYPFRNVVQLFTDDDFTMVNLESVLADEGQPAGGRTFTFRGPTAYTQILTGSSVEAVTLANNHTEDYGKKGYESTTAALENAGLAYVEENGTMLFTTESGLTIGVYAATFKLNRSDMRSDIAKLRQQGAQIVICAFHWGNEGQYRPTTEQQNNGHAAIDAGADIVYGSHPHVLQRIEEYNGGIIYYSLGNFSFGGNHFPRDMDSVIVRQEVIRREDGTVELGELTLIPVSISSMTGQNNFQPTPYEEGSKEYDRTLTKLDGTFNGPDLVVDYSFLDPTDPSETTEPADSTEPGDDADTTETTQGSGETQPDQGSDTPTEGSGSGDDTGSGSDSGNDPGSDSGSGSGDTPADPPADNGGDSGSGSGDAPAEG